MEELLEFLQNNYQIVICLLSLIIQIVFFIVRKKPSSAVFSELQLALSNKLPDLINQAELLYKKCSLSGSVKKDLVSTLALEFSEKFLKRKLKEDEITLLTDFISSSIESILGTPTRKEIK